MDSPRGSVCTESTHTVKTIDKAQEWTRYALPNHLPISIEQRKEAGGRLYLRIYDKDNNLLETRG